MVVLIYMVDKCNPNYKNLRQIQSFSEQRYATVQLMEQACSNDEYLKQFCEELDYLSHPPVRQRFNPVNVDKNRSYGYSINQDGDVVFSNTLEREININFNDTDEIKVDNIMSTVKVREEYLSDSNIVSTWVELDRSERKTPVIQGNFEKGDQINSYWYCGFNREVSYHVRPDWLQDWRDMEIPSVVRCQTFKAHETGLLEAISLAVGRPEGTANSNWGCPLYVQIWPTKKITVPKMAWDKKTKTAVQDGNLTETIYEPVTVDGDGNSMIYNPLGQGEYWPDTMEPNFSTILLDAPCKVTKDEHYAIVIFSPLSDGFGNCPRIGGWGLNCNKSKDTYGDAFLSTDNGRTFIRYGRNDEYATLYYQGMYTPRDFAYQAHISKISEEYDTGVQYLYLEPIFSNPITHVRLSANDDGEVSTGNLTKHIQYQISTNGRDWVDIVKTRETALSNRPRMLFVRACMGQTSTGNSETPIIEDITIQLKTERSTEMYVRTNPCSPKQTPMLTPALWGKINAPFTRDDESISCGVEIIKSNRIKENFIVITANELEDYLYLDGVDKQYIVNKSIDERNKYLIDNPSVIKVLREKNVYVKPFTYNDTRYDLSFSQGLQLSNSPAYPILDCMVQPRYSDFIRNYGEWMDYTVDYDSDLITFLDDATLDNLPVGGLTFEFNPVFIQNVSSEEMPLLLDYFKETFDVIDEILENRKVTLRCDAVDPIRHVYLNKDTDYERELVEDIDFIVDYANHCINFPIVDYLSESSVLSLGDVITVVYTPNLVEASIMLAYYAKRDNEHLGKQCRIKPNYIEYRV